MADINCDLGEGSQLADCEHDAQLMALISRCNIACGAHAGSTQIMQRSIYNAQAQGIKIGAHPGYADPQHFGRRSLNLPWSQLRESLLAQLDNFFDLAQSCGAQVEHIKLHGALYNDVESNPSLAMQVAGLIKQHFKGVSLLGIANGCLQTACAELDLTFLREGFIDRRYTDKGLLTPRSQTGAVLTEPEAIVEQALGLIEQQAVLTDSGKRLSIEVDSLCLHGDTPGALNTAQQLHRALQHKGIQLA